MIDLEQLDILGSVSVSVEAIEKYNKSDSVFFKILKFLFIKCSNSMQKAQVI